MTAISLNPKESAKVIRAVLKKAFPNTTFGVTTGRGAGVSSVHVRWIDGPTVREVEALTKQFEIGSFNGMTDSYEYSKREDRQLLINGVHYEAGCRYVLTSRRLSPAKANECIKMIAEYWGGVEGALPVAVEGYDGAYQIADNRGNESVRPDLDGHEYDWRTQIHRCASDPSRFTREVVAAPAPVKPIADRTWTDHTAKCTSCGNLFRVSQETIDEQRRDFDTGDSSDAEIASHMEFCFQCCDGVYYEGEKAGLVNAPDEIAEAPAPKLVLAQIDYNDFRREDIRSLDQAMYVATCFAASSNTREVAVLYKVIGDKEHYAVLDTPLATFRNSKGIDMLNDGWKVQFIVRRPFPDA